MGLDISIQVNNSDKVFETQFENYDEFSNKYNLSRMFCHLLAGREVADYEPIFDQVGKITCIDISPIYQMETYQSDEMLDEMFEFMPDDMFDTEESKKQAEEQNRLLENNIDTIIHTLNRLIEKLSNIENLEELLEFDKEDVEYFKKFNAENEDSYTRNNFGQDLRNFRNFVQFAKDCNTTTVYFVYS